MQRVPPQRFPIKTAVRLARVLAAPACLLLAAQASAAVFTVGASGTGCSHTSVQAAVNSAQATPASDSIRISRSASWTAQQIGINTDQELELIGGYATCTATAPDGTRTTLSGAGGDARPVLTVRGNGIVRLRNLTITAGDQADDDLGGGINYAGGGILDLANTVVSDNVAGDGGGIYAVGTTLAAEVVLGADVTISHNIARNSGGGMVSKSIETSLLGPRSTIMFNEAQGEFGGGYGGGLVVVSEQFKSYAYISSGGVGGIGAIFNNTAVHGGGVAVLGGVESGREAVVHVFTGEGQAPVRINGNTASTRGGAFYLKPDGDTTSGSAETYARLWYAHVTDNKAPDGAAFYLDHDDYDLANLLTEGANVIFNPLPDMYASNYRPLPAGGVPCPVGAACGSISDNTTGGENGSILTVSGATFMGRRLLMQDNSAGRLVHVLGDGSPLFLLFNSLLTGNGVSQELLRQPDEDDGQLRLHHVTIADNIVGAPHVFVAENHLALRNSIVWQPGKLTVPAGSSTEAIEHVFTNDTTHLPDGLSDLVAPRFVDAARGDYSLRAGSRGVDYAPAVAAWEFPESSAEGLDGRKHTVDVPIAGISAPNRIADMGAYERPTLMPLLLNHGFGVDLNHWDFVTPSSSWTAVGLDSPGALHVALASDDVTVQARVQCVHLPGPGTYRLNGWGKVSLGAPFDNTARLDWALRHNGGALGCTDGVPNAQGSLVLSRDSTWRKPDVPASITVTEAQWTRNTSVAIYTTVVNGNPLKRAAGDASTKGADVEGWFDGFTLEIDVNEMFKDGFE